MDEVLHDDNVQSIDEFASLHVAVFVGIGIWSIHFDEVHGEPEEEIEVQKEEESVETDQDEEIHVSVLGLLWSVFSFKKTVEACAGFSL